MLSGQRHSGRKDHRALDVLLGHDRQARIALQILWPHRLWLVRLVRIARAHLLEHLLERSRPVGEVEAEPRLAVERGDPVPGENHLLAIGRANRRDGPIVKFLGKVPGKRVSRLVAMRVAVKDPVVEFRRHGLAPSCENGYSPIPEKILSSSGNAYPGSVR